MPINQDQSPAPFTLYQPKAQTHAFLLGSPHSGRDYPASFLKQTRLSETAIRKSEDFLVDELVMSGVELGMPLLAANFPRAYLDVNREPFELDPKLFDGKLPRNANTGSTRVTNGLGTIARIVSEGEEIYQDKLPVSEALERIDRCYHPYHDQLNQLMVQTHERFGLAVLIDFHSMPSSSIENICPMGADFVLGDRFGSSCSPALSEVARNLLSEMGYHVTTNKPFAGGFITQHYGRPHRGLHTLQVEINRKLYMDEKRLEKSDGFETLKQNLTAFLSALAALQLPEFSAANVLAAE